MSDGFFIEVDADAAAAAKEAAEGGNGSFPPLAPGKYQATVVQVVKTEPFGGTGGNANKKVLRVKVQIVDDSPQGRKRVFFERIPLFTRYAPTEKNPKGASARGYWDFFGKAIGVPEADLIAGRVPGVAGIQGKRITIVVSAPIAPDQYNPLGYNEVSFWDAAGDVNNTPTAAPTVRWLDANGNLIPNWDGSGTSVAPPAPGAPAQAPAAPSAPPAWTPDAASVSQPAPGVVAAAEAITQAAAAAPAGPPAWNPADDVAAAAQQAAAPKVEQGF